jgi:hypothetical protein
MYQKASNIYKIDEDALQVSDIIRADCAGEHVVAWVPGVYDLVYGIRQYMGCIEIGGDSNTLEDEEMLLQTMEEQEFSYLVLSKGTDVLAVPLAEYFTLTGESDNYEIYKWTGDL